MAEEINVLGEEKSPFATAAGKVGQAAKTVGQGLLGVDEEPSGFQDAAFESQQVQAGMPTIYGPTSQGQAVAEKPMSKSEFLARGGIGNSIMKAVQDVRTNVAHERHKKAYMQINKEGFVGTKKLYANAIKKYPDISAWVPRPEYFLKVDGSFDTQKYHEAFRLGLLKYKESLAREAKIAENERKRKGIRDPEIQAAYDSLRKYAEENPDATEEDLTNFWNKQISAAPPRDVQRYMAGRISPKDLRRHELYEERAEKSFERSMDRLERSYALRASTAKLTRDRGKRDISATSVLSQIRQFAKMRMALEEGIDKAYSTMARLEDNNKKDDPLKPYYDEAANSYNRQKKELDRLLKITQGMVDEYSEDYPYIAEYNLKDIRPEDVVPKEGGEAATLGPATQPAATAKQNKESGMTESGVKWSIE